MQKEPLKILAINPGSRYIGFAAFRGSDLLDWGVRVNTGNTPRGKIRVAGQFLKEAIERFQPDLLAVKRLHARRTSIPLRRLMTAVRKLSRRRKLECRDYSIMELKSILCSNVNGNKRQLAATVAEVYPALNHELRKEIANRNTYYLRMFEAVALGMVCYREIEK